MAATETCYPGCGIYFIFILYIQLLHSHWVTDSCIKLILFWHFHCNVILSLWAIRTETPGSRWRATCHWLSFNCWKCFSAVKLSLVMAPCLWWLSRGRSVFWLSLWTWYVTNTLRDFPQVWHKLITHFPKTVKVFKVCNNALGLIQKSLYI